MRVKTLVTVRSKFVVSEGEEMAAATSQIPAPKMVWDPSKTTKMKIQALVECRLLRPKVEE
jgi:hypothetical protein